MSIPTDSKIVLLMSAASNDPDCHMQYLTVHSYKILHLQRQQHRQKQYRQELHFSFFDVLSGAALDHRDLYETIPEIRLVYGRD